jgi:hypothetical protein
MKLYISIISIVFICLVSSCTQRTCPTYTKGIEEVHQEQQVQVIVEENQEV